VARLVEEMEGSLAAAGGLGLAAPQVGHSRSLCLINLPLMNDKVKRPLVLINPEIRHSDGEVSYEEGCLSFPGIYAEVTRPRKVSLSGVDLEGRPVELEASDLLARVLLHETDHLKGVLFIDHLSIIKRQLLKKRLKSMRDGD
jgi:peptide deformylase